MSLAEGGLALLWVRLPWGRAEVGAALRLALPSGAEGEATFLEEVGKFLLGNGIPAGIHVVLGVPRAEFLLRRFETPPVKAHSLPELVEFEIERHLPGKREEFLCGWRAEGRGSGGGHVVLLGAARRAGLERVLVLLHKANLAPSSIQPEQLALAAECARESPGTQPALLVSLGTESVGIDLVRGARLEFARTHALAEPLWRDSFAPAAAPAEGLAEVRQNATRRVGECLLAWLRQPLFLEALPGGVVPEVRLAGYGVNRSLLIEMLQSGLGVPVQVFTPWPRVRWGAPPANLVPFEPPLAVALQAASGSRSGLELHEERQEVLHRTPSLRPTAVLAGLLVLLLLAHVGSVALRRQRLLERVEREIRTLKVQMAEVEAVNRQVKEQREHLRYLTATVRDRPRQAELLRELTALVPADTYLSEYVFREKSLEITGHSPGASRLLPLLEESQLFKSVEFSAPIVAQGGGLERFRVRMLLEVPGG